MAAEGRTLTVPLGTTLDEIELRVILETRRHVAKNLAAQLLKISVQTNYRRLNREKEKASQVQRRSHPRES